MFRSLLRTSYRVCTVRFITNAQFAVADVDYTQLFSEALQNEGFRSAKSLFYQLSKHMPKGDLSRVWVSSMLNFQPYVSDAVDHWMSIVEATGTTDGIDLLWDHILAQNNTDTFVYSKILKYCQKYEDPYATLAQLICCLIKAEKVNVAEKVFAKVFISGQFFRRPLKLLVADGDVHTIENLAKLVSIYMELQPRKAKIQPFEDSNDFLDRALPIVQPRNNLLSKKRKIKVHRARQDEIFHLLNNIKRAWLVLSEDEYSKKRCINWYLSQKLIKW